MGFLYENGKLNLIIDVEGFPTSLTFLFTESIDIVGFNYLNEIYSKTKTS